jgi:hypothetical protein
MTLGAVPPESWNLPLLVHVAGAMLLVGALTLAATALIGKRGTVGQRAELARCASAPERFSCSHCRLTSSCGAAPSGWLLESTWRYNVGGDRLRGRGPRPLDPPPGHRFVGCGSSTERARP